MVWSDPKIQELSREFVTVAEEVHFLYPEGHAQIARVRNDPAHKFFKRYGESAPDGSWNHPGTKQGIYMMGPDAEFLEGGGAISGGVAEMRRKLETALSTWKTIAKKKKYKNKKVPRSKNIVPARAKSKPHLFRVFLRDLPRSKRDKSGRRFTPKDINGIWPDFVKWAWNINWFGIDDQSSLVPKGKKEEAVDQDLIRRIYQNTMVDNVRGQNPPWRGTAVKEAEMRMRITGVKGHLCTIEYRGKAIMDSGRQKFAPTIYGKGIWDRKKRAFQKLEILGIGYRSGQGNFNQRRRDTGTAPMGVALIIQTK
ncbi:MAG: hypothetical protein ACI97A_004174 [Planctomycetota bacterium]|jgi:hypothetical protein